jgi:RNA polymerase sigma-70 factor (ECF subfamily)
MDFERWIAPHAGAIRALAVSVLGNRADAEDVVQETMLAAYENRALIDPAKNPRAWVLRIALNKSRDLLRRRKVRQRLPEPKAPAPGADVEEIRLAFRRLPDEYRLILHLAYFEELPYRDIAEVTGLSLSGVKMAVLRGRKMLRGELE